MVAWEGFQEEVAYKQGSKRLVGDRQAEGTGGGGVRKRVPGRGKSMLEGLGTMERGKIIWLGCGQWPWVRLELWARQALEASLMSSKSPEILGSHSSLPQVVPLDPILHAQSRNLRIDMGSPSPEGSGSSVACVWTHWLSMKGKKLTHREEL